MGFRYSMRLLVLVVFVAALVSAIAERYLRPSKQIVVAFYVDKEQARLYPRADVSGRWINDFDKMLAPRELIAHGDISHPLEDLIAVLYVTDAAGATSWKGVYTVQMGGGVLVLKKEKADGQMYRINLQGAVATLRSVYRQTRAASSGRPMKAKLPSLSV